MAYIDFQIHGERAIGPQAIAGIGQPQDLLDPVEKRVIDLARREPASSCRPVSRLR